MQIQEILKKRNGTVVDVRTREEYMSGSVPKSVNIPLQELDQRMQELKKLPQPLVLCCASGNRSGMAAQILTHQGIKAYNGGSWRGRLYSIQLTYEGQNLERLDLSSGYIPGIGRICDDTIRPDTSVAGSSIGSVFCVHGFICFWMCFG